MWSMTKSSVGIFTRTTLRRTGLPQLYIMNSDGSNVQQMTDGGYVSSPSWSPNGQFITFAWNRKYGPGAPGGQDIYSMEVATRTGCSLHSTADAVISRVGRRTIATSRTLTRPMTRQTI